MSNEAKNKAESAAAGEEQKEQEVVKKKTGRRGLGSARGAQRLKFSHSDALPTGLFLGHLESVDYTVITIGEDKTGMPSFNGCEIPKLVFTFASNDDDPARRKYMTLQFNAVESNTKTIPGGEEEWKVNAPLDWLKHILNVYYLKGRAFTEEEEIALSLPFEDFDEEGAYVPLAVEEIIGGWRTLLQNVEHIMNHGRDGQPVYKSKDGKAIAVYMKFLRYNKNKKKGWTPINNGELAFPTFVGEGCLEIFKQNVMPAIRLNPINEAIIPMNIENKAKAPNMPGVPAAMGGTAVPGIGGDMGGVPFDPTMAAAAGEDLPF